MRSSLRLIALCLLTAAMIGCGSGPGPVADTARSSGDHQAAAGSMGGPAGTAAAVAPPMPELSGPYLGQTPPGREPEVFAPGIVSTGMHTRDLTMTPDGNEIYFSVALPRYTVTTILVTRLEDGHWTAPEVVPFATDPRYLYCEPHVAPDGSRLFFLSNQPQPGKPLYQGDQDIWVTDRLEQGWCEPYNLGPPVNTGNREYFPSVTSNGTLYFTREGKDRRAALFRSRLVDGRYTEPERLPDEVNAAPSQFNAYVAPDESYLIFCAVGLSPTYGGTDYYICFRNADDTWSPPVNLGAGINTAGGNEFSPSVSPDGRYLFFMSSRTGWDRHHPPEVSAAWLHEAFTSPQNGDADIYWVDASFLGPLRLSPAADPNGAGGGR